MADDNIKPIDIDQKPIMRSDVRAGCKRELAFALKSLFEIDSNLAPVRLRKPPIPFCPTSTSLSTALGKRAKAVRSIDMLKKRGRQVKASSSDRFSSRRFTGAPILVSETLEILDDHGGSSVNVPIDINEMPPILTHESRSRRQELSYEIENLVGEALFSTPVIYVESLKKAEIFVDSSNIKDHQLMTGKDKGIVTYDPEEDVDMDEGENKCLIASDMDVDIGFLQFFSLSFLLSRDF